MNKKAHILVVSQYFYPEQFRINDICREWVRRGYRVTVLTGIPNYPQGKFYTGYGGNPENSSGSQRKKFTGVDPELSFLSGSRLFMEMLYFHPGGFRI